MEPAANATVYIVDDDAEVREALAWLLRSRRLLSEAFASAEAFELMLAERKATGMRQRHSAPMAITGSICPKPS